MASKANQPGDQVGVGRIPIPKMKRGLRAYFHEVGVEMRKVIWPSRADTVRLTGGVLMVSFLFIMYLWAAGYVIDLIITFLEKGKL